MSGARVWSLTGFFIATSSRASSRFRSACLLVFGCLFPPFALANDTAGSAYGESVDVTVSVPLVGDLSVTSGPIPQVMAQTPPDFDETDSLANVSVGAGIALVPGGVLSILDTGLLQVTTEGDGTPGVQSSATVDDVDVALGSDLVGLLLLLGIEADTIASTAEIGGSCGALMPEGSTTLENATLDGSVPGLLGLDVDLAVNPAPNTVLLAGNVDIGGGEIVDIRLVLNEQIVSGDGVATSEVTVNAIHLTASGLDIGLGLGLDADIIIGQSQASATCDLADVAITMTDNPDPVTEGESLTYTLNVSNSGPDEAGNVQVTDLLPAGLGFDSATPTQGSCQENAGVVDCDLGDLANGGDATITLVVTPSAAGLVTNEAMVSTSAADTNTGNNSASESTTVAATVTTSDLSISKSASPDPVMAGETLTYTVTVSNAGPDDAPDVAITDILPANVTFQSATASQGSCQHNAGTVNCMFGTVANGGSASATIMVVPQVPGDLSNTATVAAGNDDPAPDDNTSTVTTTVEAATTSSDLSIGLSASPDPVTVGETLTYTVMVNNGGPDDAPDVTMTNTLPGDVTFQSATASQGSCQHSAGTVSCMFGAVASGGGTTATIMVVPQVAGDLSNTASVAAGNDDPNPGDNSATVMTTVEAADTSSDLSVTASASPDPVTAGETLTYTIPISNAGPDEAPDVVLTSMLADDVTFTSASPSQGSCQHTAGNVSCQLGALASSGNASVTIMVVPLESGDVANSVSVAGGNDDPDLGNNSATVTTTVDAAATTSDLSIFKSANPDPATVGEVLTYTVSVSNAGPDEAPDVAMTDMLSADVSFQSVVASQGSCQHSAGTVTCDFGALASGASATANIDVIPQVGGDLSNTAAVSSGSNDPNPDDNTVTITTSVDGSSTTSDLSVTKVSDASEVLVGETVTYTITVSNAGPDDAEDVVVEDQLPTAVTFESVSTTQGSCGHSNRLVSCDLGTVANNGSATVTIEVTADEAGDLVNTAVVRSGSSDPDPDDDDDTTTMSVGIPPDTTGADLRVVKFSRPSAVVLGDTLTYYISVTNQGPEPATNVVVTDDLPDGFTVDTVTETQGNCSVISGLVDCELGTIGFPGSATILITGYFTTTGIISNTVLVDSDDTDPDPDDNSSRTSTEVVSTSDELPDLENIPVMSPVAMLVLVLNLLLLGGWAMRRYH